MVGVALEARPIPEGVLGSRSILKVRGVGLKLEKLQEEY